MNLLYIFLLGFGILVCAIVLNIVADLISLTTWYEFIKQPSKANFVSYIWLFIIYPFVLGLVAYYLSKLFNL